MNVIGLSNASACACQWPFTNWPPNSLRMPPRFQCARSASTTRKPTLCRCFSYWGPGLPNPTISNIDVSARSNATTSSFQLFCRLQAQAQPPLLPLPALLGQPLQVSHQELLLRAPRQLLLPLLPLPP